MAKIKKRKLRWKASDSSQVIGYKLYWSEDGVLNYDSSSKMVGNVTEIILPDDVADFKPKPGPILFGVTAVDELGNESDMVTLAAPYQFSVPKAPDELHMQTMNEYYASHARQSKSADPVEANPGSPVDSNTVIRQFSRGQNTGEPDLSTKLNLIAKQALAF